MDIIKILFIMLYVFVNGSLTVRAELYIWTDSNGIKHVSNSKPQDSFNDLKTFDEKEYSYKDGGENSEILDVESKKEKVKKPSKKKNKRKNKKKQEKREYHYLWWQPVQKENKLRIMGRISSGEFCESLLLKVKLKNEFGTKKTVNCMVQNAGAAGSKIIDGSAKIKGKRGKRWKVLSVRAICQE